ncbi:MAG: hypothetical protein J6S60_04550 [Oscillospiraceae bacterium]|nr:hypothetical protein [Oscillospiraceae bacterium]
MGYPYFQQPYQMYPQPVQPQASRAVEVFQVESEQAVLLFPVSNGATQMLLDRNDSFIAVKSAALDGTVSVTYYDRRPPAPAAAPFDPAQYVTRDELPTLLADALAEQKGKKKEAAE